jgi:DNA-directed RNA polymerase specialized sigma24 family protein
MRERAGTGLSTEAWREAADAVRCATSPWEGDGFAALYALALREGRRTLRGFRTLDDARRDDLAAEVITRRLREVAGATRPRAYFRVALRRTALSWIRGERLTLREEGEVEYVEGPLDEEETRAVYAIDARGALAGMGARERAVLVADACGEAREAIAKAWGTSRANVDQIVSRGRRRVGDA